MMSEYGDYDVNGDLIPNPLSVGSGLDVRARFGELTPLPTKLANYYQGVNVGGFQMLTVTNAAQFLPRSSSAISALLQVQGEPIRWTIDGTTPTATVGFRVDPDTTLRVTGPQDLLAFQMIREAGVDAVVAINFFA